MRVTLKAKNVISITGTVISNSNGYVEFETKRPRSSKMITITVGWKNIISLYEDDKGTSELTYYTETEISSTNGLSVVGGNDNFTTFKSKELSGKLHINTNFMCGDDGEEVVASKANTKKNGKSSKAEKKSKKNKSK